MINQGMMTSIKKDYGTPQWIIDEFGPFDLDVAASEENAKAPNYLTEEQDALHKDTRWTGAKVWCNPPYGKLLKWTAKAKEEAALGSFSTLYMLLPARTDTKWFKAITDIASDVWLFRGRITFEGQAHPAPFPSMVVKVGDKGDVVETRWHVHDYDLHNYEVVCEYNL